MTSAQGRIWLVFDRQETAMNEPIKNDKGWSGYAINAAILAAILVTTGISTMLLLLGY